MPNLRSPFEEAKLIGCTKLIKLFLEYSIHEKRTKWEESRSSLNKTLLEMDDFYVEMKWECDSSYIPFVKHVTPNETYLISKKGCKLRIDTKAAGDKIASRNNAISLLYNCDTDG